MRFTLKNMMLCIAIAAVSLAFYTPVWLFPGLIALLETLRREVAGLQAEVQRPRRENNELCQDAGCWRRRHRDVMQRIARLDHRALCSALRQRSFIRVGKGWPQSRTWALDWLRQILVLYRSNDCRLSLAKVSVAFRTPQAFSSHSV